MITLCSPEEARLPTALALGSFDGLHEGHRQVIEKITQAGLGIPSVVSFWPHPREVLYGECRLRLDLPEEKAELLGQIGVEQLVLIPFNESLASLKPEEFIKKVLLQTLKAKRIAVGEDFLFGKNRSGNSNTLKSIANGCGVEVDILKIIKDTEGRISSSRIRSALGIGDINKAQILMGRPYKFKGLVVKGRGIGRKIGWPTANLEVDGRKFLPGIGVYACWVWLTNQTSPFAAVMNLGPQPTVDPDSPSAVEVHLLDEKIDLTGANLIVQPIKRLRGQTKFLNINELSNQIGKDAEQARRLLIGGSSYETKD